MSIPEMPWYGAMEQALKPVDRYTAIGLIVIGAACFYLAWKGDAVTRMAMLIYLISP